MSPAGQKIKAPGACAPGACSGGHREAAVVPMKAGCFYLRRLLLISTPPSKPAPRRVRIFGSGTAAGGSPLLELVLVLVLVLVLLVLVLLVLPLLLVPGSFRLPAPF